MTLKTVFVIGAGASNEVNLPTGKELKTNIANLLDMRWGDFGSKLEHGDFLIAEALKNHVRQLKEPVIDINPWVREAWSIRDALPLATSIDHFIDTHHDNEKLALCGKLAIVRSILQNEKNSLLFFDQGIRAKMNFIQLEKTWYNPFFQLLIENCRPIDIKQRLESITLIIFNYDRCVEHFIYNALQFYYKIPPQEANELVKLIHIFHPYGVVGDLPWLGQNTSMEFGQEPRPNQLLELSQKIKTYTEGTDPRSSEILKIKEQMRKAERVVFLGFAFHTLNMELIQPDQVDATPSNSIRCYATAYGISSSNRQLIKKDLLSLFQGSVDVEIADLKCAGLFQEYSRNLSF